MKRTQTAGVIKKLKNIIKGWSKTRGWVDTSAAEEKMSALRMEKCNHCLYSTESKVLKIIKGTAVHEAILKCGICSCPCEEKTIVTEESCPKGKW